MSGEHEIGAVFLIGFMGAGKSAVGRALAARLDRRFVDTDALVERRDGRPIARIFEESGEAVFRRIETETLRAIDVTDGPIVATGGGLFAREENRHAIEARGTSVWLDAPLETIWERCRAAGGRPLMTGRAEVERLLAERRPAYERADLRLDAAGRSVDEIAEALLRRLRAPSSDRR